jgi:hypothetical protein
MKRATTLFFFAVLCITAASAQQVHLNSQYFWCPSPSANRTINLCNPASGQAATGVLTLNAAVRDSNWPIKYEVLLNGRDVSDGQQDMINDDLWTLVDLDPVNTAQTVTLRFYDSQGSFEKTFKAYNLLNPPCTLPTGDQSVVMCSPDNNATLTSPLQIKAAATDSNPNELWWVIYLDGHPLAQQQWPNGTNGHDFATTLQSYTGKHKVTVQAHENNGTGTFQASAYVNITAPAGCAPTLPGPSVYICSPGTTTTGTRLHVVAKAYDGYDIKWMQIYLDRKEVYTIRNTSLDTYIPVTSGTHRLTVTETNYAGSGVTYSTTEYVTVN